MSKAIFLDRDGVVIIDHGYNSKPEDLSIIPKAPEALRGLRSLGFKLVIVTNQSGIKRGLYTIQDYYRFQALVEREFEKESICFDGVYFCPHHNEDKCECRKPKIGLVKKAQEKFSIDTARSFFVGDKDSDVLCGQNAGCRAVRIKSNYPMGVKPDMLISDLFEFYKKIKSG